jgi:hypothetical protein
MDFTKPATNATVHILNTWLTFSISFNDVFWAKGYTDPAGLTPVVIEKDIEKLFPFCCRFFRRRLSGAIFSLARCCHLNPHDSKQMQYVSIEMTLILA